VDPRKLSALVVDDEPSLVRVVEGYLSKDGFDVRTARDGETAVAVARESEPDLVVLDSDSPASIPAVIADPDRIQEVLGTSSTTRCATPRRVGPSQRPGDDRQTAKAVIE